MNFFILIPVAGDTSIPPPQYLPTLSTEFLATVAIAACDGTAQALASRIEANLASHPELRAEKRTDFEKVVRYLRVCCP